MSNFLIEVNKYGKYYVPKSSSHRGCAKHILNHTVYEPKTIEFVIQNVGKGDILHAGAYFGDFIPAFAKNCKGTVWAFEPNIENFGAAEKTIEANNLKNVKLFNAALTDTNEGDSNIKIKEKSHGAMGGISRIVDHDDVDSTHKVKNMMIDDIEFDNPCTIIQLDVEGHEIQAMKGALNTVKKYHPIIMMEEWKGVSFNDDPWFKENILSLGYKKIDKIHSNAIYKIK